MLRLLKWLLGLCRHDDEIQDTSLLKSPAIEEKEAMVELGSAAIVAKGSVPIQFYQSVLVTIVRCKKCGRVKHVRTQNP